MKNGVCEMIIAPAVYPGKLYRNRYAYEHHIIWWKNTKNIPPAGYEIHHINGKHRDNRFSNIVLLTSSDHRKVHSDIIKSKCRKIIFCGWCNKKSIVKGNEYRFRLKNNKFGKLFCSKNCGAKHQFGSGRKDRRFSVKEDQAGAVPASQANLSKSFNIL